MRDPRTGRFMSRTKPPKLPRPKNYDKWRDTRCEQCGRIFGANHKDAMYCGDVCRSRAYRERHKVQQLLMNDNETKFVKMLEARLPELAKLVKDQPGANEKRRIIRALSEAMKYGYAHAR